MVNSTVWPFFVLSWFCRDPAADVVLQKIRGAGEPQAGGVDGEVIGVPMSPLGGTVFVVVGGAALISLADKLQRLVLGQVMGLLDALAALSRRKRNCMPASPASAELLRPRILRER